MTKETKQKKQSLFGMTALSALLIETCSQSLCKFMCKPESTVEMDTAARNIFMPRQKQVIYWAFFLTEPALAFISGFFF